MSVAAYYRCLAALLLGVVATWVCWILVAGLSYTAPEGPQRLRGQLPGILTAVVVAGSATATVTRILSGRWLTPWLLIALAPLGLGLALHL
jgi:hypothetical protein